MSTDKHDHNSDELGAARISDPDDYSMRRRLKQIHDAKEEVADIAQHTTRLVLNDRSFTEADRDQLVAEAVAQYIAELESVIQQLPADRQPGPDDDPDTGDGDGSPMQEPVATIDGDAITLQDIVDSRGRLGPDGQDAIPYEAAMTAYRTCTQYLDEVAGPESDTGTPIERSFDTTDDESGGHVDTIGD